MVVFASCERMEELPDGSVQLVVTSPPYYNAPFDYENWFPSYEAYLELIRAFAREVYRVLEEGRVAAVNCDDMLIDGEKYPIVADTTRIFIEVGFRYRDRITWEKPEGYIRISRRSGVMVQHPYPMYYYPDNIQESILIFQKGKMDYRKIRHKKDPDNAISMEEYLRRKWFLNVWRITNRLPNQTDGFSPKEYPAAFPEELPYRLIKLFSYRGETVLDPFLGSGTTAKVAGMLGRNSVGYEINPELRPLIERRIRAGDPEAQIEFRLRERAKPKSKPLP